MAKIYEFPSMINGMYTQAYIEWSYDDFYEQEQQFYFPDQVEQKKESCLSKLFRKIFAS